MLALDLNCAIYHCVRKVQRKLPYNDEIKARWEAQLIDTVVAYIKQLNSYVKPKDMLYIAVDGVAPMAKIKQQRMRRFKSTIVAQEEARIRAVAKGVPYVPEPRWDSNAITPGTSFMSALAAALRTYADKQPSKIRVSPADEPGEGEQKIMDYVRKHRPADVVVYGLDADLIVLSLIGTTYGTKMDLFREEVEFNGGGVKEDAHGNEQYLYLHCEQLGKILFEAYGRPGAQTQAEFLLDFAALMNLLGNDFVPHGMGLKIKDGGIETILALYKDRLRVPLLTNGGYNVEALKVLFKILAENEPVQMLRSVRKKLTARTGYTASKDPEEIALARYNDSPVLWAAEAPLVTYMMVEDHERPVMVLKNGWEAEYDRLALWDADPEKAAEVYLQSLAWTLAYYTGAPVDLCWYYPWMNPPRFATISKVLETKKALDVPNASNFVLKPLEQLAMVLPASSFHLLPKEYARLPLLYPHAWPETWPLYSFGRRQMWECEPRIPLVQPHQIRHWIDVLYDEN